MVLSILHLTDLLIETVLVGWVLVLVSFRRVDTPSSRTSQGSHQKQMAEPGFGSRNFGGFHTLFFITVGVDLFEEQGLNGGADG